MSFFSRKTKRRPARKKKTPRPSLLDWLADIDESTRHQIARGTITTVVILGVAVVAGIGLSRVRERVYAGADDAVAIRPVWDEKPAWLPSHVTDGITRAVLARSDLRLIDPSFAKRVAETVATNGWVQRVRRVEKFADGRVELVCEFREPIAAVYQFPNYYLIDREGVRLPGLYDGAGELPLIQGARSPAPAEGEKWIGEDLHAGIRLAALLGDQIYAYQVAGISVENYNGRLKRDDTHIRIQTVADREGTIGGVVLWGSAIGREAEEPTADEKLEILAANWQQTRRIDAGLDWIDVSVGRARFRAAEYADASNLPPPR